MKMKFYDLKKKKSFETDKYTIKKIKTKAGMRKVAVAIAPSGIKAFRFMKM